MLVYMARNTINGKVYIGQTNGKLTTRRATHIRSATKEDIKCRAFNCPFYVAIREHGVGSFEWSVIWEREKDDPALLDIMEKKYQVEYRAFNSEYGYNRNKFSRAPRHSEETKKKLSDVHIDRVTGYIMTSPSGDTFECYCLYDFCNDYGLNQKHINRVATGYYGSHHGWKCVHMDKERREAADKIRSEARERNRAIRERKLERKRMRNDGLLPPLDEQATREFYNHSEIYHTKTYEIILHNGRRIIKTGTLTKIALELGLSKTILATLKREGGKAKTKNKAVQSIREIIW